MNQQNEVRQEPGRKHPKVSVVIPTHNRAKELPRSIRSVLAQTFTDFELIIVDDASTDDTEEVVSSFCDDRLCYKKLEVNVGGAEARNIGVGLAKGDIVAFQDSDDEWTCSKLEVSVSKLEQSNRIGALFSQFIQVSPESCRLMPTGVYSFDSSDVYKSLLWQNHVGTPTLVVKKSYLELVGGFTPEMPRYQDWDLALKLASVTKIEYLKEPMLLSYVTEGSITQNKVAHGEALEILYKKHMIAISSDRRLKAAWLHRLGDARISAEDKSGRWLLFEALKLEPYSLRYGVKFVFSLFGSSTVYIALTGLFRR